MKKEIEWLLFHSNISNYRISQATGISAVVLGKYTTGKSDVGRMTLNNAEKLYSYYVEVMTVEFGDSEYILSNPPEPTGRDNEWSAKAKTIDGHSAVVYWMGDESGQINPDKPAHAELVY